MTDPRYAIYYAPDEDSALWLLGSRCLGRDAINGRSIPRNPINGFSVEMLNAFTETPRKYGFHGTLKPPFHLAKGKTEAELIQAIGTLAACQTPFRLPPLKLSELGNFIALCPQKLCTEMKTLAATCVRDLDSFRRLSSEEDIKQRRSDGLSPPQEENLIRWGYPYVMDEFRFHMTLTGSLEYCHRNGFMVELLPHVEGLSGQGSNVDSLCLFVQNSRAEPFNLRRRFSFGDAIKQFSV